MKSKLLLAAAAFFVLVLAIVLASPTLSAPAAETVAKDDGKDLYVKKCAMCHGADGVAKAMAKGSANLNDPEWLAKTTDDAIAAVTREGKNKMPGFEGKLTPEQVQLIVAHVRTLKK